MRLQSLKLVILTACRKGAQALLQKDQKAPPKAAMAFQAQGLLLRLMRGLKVNPTVKVEQRFQAQELLLPLVMGLKVNPTAKMEQRSQVQELLVYRMLEHQVKPLVNPIVRVAHHLQGQRTRRQHQHPSRRRPVNQRLKVALRKQGPPDQCRRLVPNLSQAALLGRTFPS